MTEQHYPIKLIVLGSWKVGKTCLLISYALDRFPQEYIPTVFESYVEPFTSPADNVQYGVGLWDIETGDGEERLRRLGYPQTDIFMLCFDIGSSKSYEDIRIKWAPEVRRYCPEAIVVLVATKIDLRDTEEAANMAERDAAQFRSKSQGTPLTFEHGSALAKEIGAAAYFECSAVTGEGVKNAFHEARKLVVEKINREKQSDRDGGGGCCVVL